MLQELSLAAGIVSCWRDKASYFDNALTYGLYNQEKSSNVFCDELVEYEGQSVADIFRTVLHLAQKNDLQFAILSNGSGWLLEPLKLQALLLLPEVQSRAISVRAGKILGKGFNFSPKFPFIDENFIIVNIKRCKELDLSSLIQRTHAVSHFKSWGGTHAELTSFFEAYISYGELYVYSDGSDCKNIYGEFRYFENSPYLYSGKDGFLASDPMLDERVHNLRANLLSRLGIKGTTSVDEYVQRFQKPSAYEQGFLKRPLAARIAKDMVTGARKLMGGINYEIQKKYEKI